MHDNEKQKWFDPSNCEPAILILLLFRMIRPDCVERIVPHFLCKFERETRCLR